MPGLAEKARVIFWLPSLAQERVLSEPEKNLSTLEPKLESLASEELFELACTAEFLGQSAKAKAYCRKALERSLGHFPSLYALALFHFRDSKNLEAKRFVKRAIRLDPQAAKSLIHFQKRLRSLIPSPESSLWASWALEEVQRLKKASDETRFELAKILFEQSRWDESMHLFQSLLPNAEFANESGQYLSYIFERLYKGEDLISQYLGLAAQVKEKADLFFNLGMIFQNDRKFGLHSLQFFYLAHREDPHDPGLRFSLEQACMDHIGRSQEARSEAEFVELMFAHLYYGSAPVAERYARVLSERWNWRFPESLRSLGPEQLWTEWLTHQQSPAIESLHRWFGPSQEQPAKRKGQDE